MGIAVIFAKDTKVKFDFTRSRKSLLNTTAIISIRTTGIGSVVFAYWMYSIAHTLILQVNFQFKTLI
jgi:hypothetical protein